MRAKFNLNVLDCSLRGFGSVCAKSPENCGVIPQIAEKKPRNWLKSVFVYMFVKNPNDFCYVITSEDQKSKSVFHVLN